MTELFDDIIDYLTKLQSQSSVVAVHIDTDPCGGLHSKQWLAGGEGQIPYDLTFNWNIINKRKKQTKYNQRH